jgi:hypothetical protein
MIAITGLHNVGDHDGTTALSPWTTPACPPRDTRGIRDMGISRPSHVEHDNRSTLQQRVLVPNPQHLLLTLNIETSLHEEKCPL